MTALARTPGNRPRIDATLASAVALLLAVAAPAAAADPVAAAPPRGAADRGAAGHGEPLVLLHSPGLERLVSTRLAPALAVATGIRIEAEAEPSRDDLRTATTDGRPADVLLVDDVDLFNERLGAAQAPSYLVVAVDSMVVAYRPESTYAKAIDADRPWFEALRAGGVRFARADPAQDPAGARTLFVLQLAGRLYGNDGLASSILQSHQIVPAGEVVPRVQRGEADVAIVRRSDAVAASLSVLQLPPEIDLADPGRRGTYAEAVTTVAGRRVRAAPLALAVAQLGGAPHAAAALRFIDFLGTPPGRRILDQSGYLFAPGLPRRRALGEAP